MKRQSKLQLVLGLLLGGLTLSTTGQADQIVSTWLGGAGNWGETERWDPHQVPNNGADRFSVFLSGSGGAMVMLDLTAMIDNLFLAANDQLIIRSAGQLGLDASAGGGLVANGGLLELESGGSVLLSGGTVTLTGGGLLNLADHATLYGTAGARLLNLDQRIAGAGTLGDGNLRLTNSGVIEANVAGNRLVVHASDDPNGTVNSGTLQARDGGILHLEHGVFANTNGAIGALSGATVELSGVTIAGGTLDGPGLVELWSGSTTFANLANRAAVTVDSGAGLKLLGTLANYGTLTFPTSGSGILISGGTVRLEGGGAIGFARYGQITGDSSQNLVNVDNTIWGAGQIGDTYLTLTNSGLIDANLPVPIFQPLTIQAGGTANLVNTGTLRASGNGKLRLIPGTHTVDNTGGIIAAADPNSVVEFSGALTGGTLSGAGQIHLVSGAQTTLTRITNEALLLLDYSSQVKLVGALTNRGHIVFSSSNPLYLYISGGAVQLDGGGIVDLGLRGQIGGQSTGQYLTNVDNTLRGAGQIGDSYLTFANAGVVDANLPWPANPPLVIQWGNGGVVNSGRLQASGNGKLRLTAGGQPLENTGGVIAAVDPNSVVEIQGASINGGTLSGAGQIHLSTAGGVLTRVTNEAALTVDSAAQVKLVGALTNRGRITLSSSGSASLAVSGGPVRLDGGGPIDLGRNGQIRPDGYNPVLFIDDNEVHGAGYIAVAVNNAGLIHADQPAAVLAINTGALALTNRGTLQASNSGTLQFTGTLTGDPNGEILALDTARVELRGAVVDSRVRTLDSGVVCGTGVTLTGLLHVTGQFNLGCDPAPATALISGVVHFAGGTVFLTPGSSLHANAGESDLLVNDADSTIRGAGIIGYPLPTIVNTGVIEAADQQTLTLAGSSAAAIVNTGTLRAVRAGTLNCLGGEVVNYGAAGPGIIANEGGTLLLERDANSGTPLTVSGGLLRCSPGQRILGRDGVTLTNVTLEREAEYVASHGETIVGGNATQADGCFAAVGGTLRVSGNVAGAGTWQAGGDDPNFPGGLILLAHEANVHTSGRVQVNNGAQLVLEGALLTGADLLMDALGRVSIDGTVALSGSLDLRSSDENAWSWAAGSTLNLSGGAAGGGCNSLFWSCVELASTDQGSGGSGVGNFGLSAFALADNAAVALVDRHDNGNRGGQGGADEALYTDALTLGAGAVLNLNGLHLYVAGQPVVPGPYGGGAIVDQPVVRAGDVSLDGRVDFGDINPFVGVLTGAIVDPLAVCAADCNADGHADFGDINPFVALLSVVP